MTHDVPVKVTVHRDLSDLDPQATVPEGWVLTSLADLGEEDFASAMLRAAQDDPFDASTEDSALGDLRELIAGAAEAFDADRWLHVEDAEGEIGVVLPQPYPGEPTIGTIFYVGVVPGRRGSGQGRRLHRLGLERLREAGVELYADSTARDNTAMVAVFTANGCRVDEESPQRDEDEEAPQGPGRA